MYFTRVFYCRLQIVSLLAIVTQTLYMQVLPLPNGLDQLHKASKRENRTRK